MDCTAAPDPLSSSCSSSAGSCSRFVVCADVELGPSLQGHSATELAKNWSHVSKNKDSSDPSKTQGDPRFSGNPQAQADMRGKVEAMDALSIDAGSNLVYYDFLNENLLAKAVHVAFYNHYPLRLSPDVMWLTIVQGLAKHIDKDPEGQRANFVNFDGKQTITVKRPDFVKGAPMNDWTTVFPEFVESIAKFTGQELSCMLSNDFSTSSLSDRICSHIALMDTVKHYFRYTMLCGCGIPSIELTGNAADWTKLRRKAEILNEFGLDWWTEELFPVLDHFVAAAHGQPDIRFWKSVCNLHGGSGFWMNYVTGWIQVFFPYLNSGEKARGLGQWRVNYEKGTGDETANYNRGIKPQGFGCETGAGYGLKLKSIPSGLSQAPFLYVDVPTSRRYDMTFNGGVVAVLQDTNTMALEPVLGWAVLDHGEIKENS